jgi:alpha-L-rhamnosidase
MNTRLLFFVIFFAKIQSLVCQNNLETINPRLALQHWNARWIAHPTASPTAFGVFHFRKKITLAERPARYIVHLSADQRYRFFVNGQSVCTGPARSDPQHWNFESVDLSPYLKEGPNTLAAVVWNAGPHAPLAQMSYRTGFLLEGDTEREAAANTDPTWKVWQNQAYAPLPVDNSVLRTYIVVGAGEQVDATRYPWGWEYPDFDDSAWPPAAALWFSAKPRGLGTDGNWMLVPRQIPQLEETPERLDTICRSEGLAATADFLRGKKPLRVPPHARATLLLDQGHLTNAYPQLLLSGGAGSRVRLTYAEALVDSLRQKGNRNELAGKKIIGFQDLFLPDGGQSRRFAPLWFRTFRFVEISIETTENPLILEDFYGIFTGYPLKDVSNFRSNDPSLDKIWEVGWRTARLCALETYVDCPYYEQLQYAGDTRIQALISLYMTGDDRLVRKALDDYDHSRIPDGLPQSRYPCSDMQVIPPFSLFWVSMVHDHWMLRGDTALLRRYERGIAEVLDWYADRLDARTALNGPLEWWQFVDWCWPWSEENRTGGVPPGASQGGSSILSLQYAYTLQQASELFFVLSKKQKALEYRQLAQKITRAARRECWDSARQLLADTPEKKTFSQHANIWAVLTDALPLAEQAGLLRRTLADSSLTQATFYFKFYLFEALKKARLGDAFLPQMKPWHDMIALGGLTTFAETPEPTRSDCHAWSASPNYEFLSLVCGIRPAAPGFRRVRIEPFLGNLEWAEGKMPTPQGEIRVHIAQHKNGGLTATLTLPPNATGTFVWQDKTVPLRAGRQVLRFIHG